MASKLLGLRALLKPQNGLTRMYSEGLPPNIRRGFERFQKDDGVPVYLKGGAGDRILFGITVLIVAGGLVDSAYTLARLDKRA